MPQLSPPQVDLRPLHEATEVLTGLTRDGWIAQDGLDTVALTRTDAHEARELLRALEPLAPALVDVRVLGRRNGATLELRRVGPAYEVTTLPEVTPAELFEDSTDLDHATRAWDRDPEAAFALPLTWQVHARIGLERLLDIPDGLDLRVVLTAPTVVKAFAGATLGDLRHLVPPGTKRRIYLALDASGAALHLGSVTLAGLVSEAADTPRLHDRLIVPAVSEPLPAEKHEHPVLDGVPLPAALLASDEGATTAVWQPTRYRCESLARVLTWAMAASDVHVDGPEISLVFRGFKRVTMTLLTSEEPGPADVSEALRLRRWVFYDASPDRMLAVRQVISLYEGADAVRHAQDVLESAEMVYVGLRTDAVAEVVQSVRQAQGQTLETVRQTLKAVQDLAKSAAERLVATLIAVGAVVIANAGKSISDEVGRNLLLFVAAFLAILAVYAVFIEGPLLSLPLRELDADLRSGAPLLTEEQRERLVELPSVGATRRRVVLLRVLVPCTYVALVILILGYGFPKGHP